MSKLVVITGAGISIDSGIPPFRGTPDALWENEVTYKGTFSHFKHRPADSWKWYLDRFTKYINCIPNEAHFLIAALKEKWERVDVITQNVDLLHEKAGTENLIKIHGSMDKIRCSRHGCDNGGPRGSLSFDMGLFQPFALSGDWQDLPRCQKCSKLLRPHVLWFDELYSSHEEYRIEEALKAVENCDEIWFIGTSFAVTFPEVALKNAIDMDKRIKIIDPFASPHPHAETFAETAISFLRRQ